MATDRHTHPGVDAGCVRTMRIRPVTGTAIDPLAQEYSAVAWRLAGADPGRTREGVAEAAASAFGALVESAWRPGCSVLMVEIEAVPAGQGVRLEVRLLLGALGALGSTRSELEGFGPAVRGLLLPGRSGLPFRGEPFDPAVMVPGFLNDGDADDATLHSAVIRQQSQTLEIAGESVEVLSRFNPTMDPWTPVAQQLVEYAAPVTVRATLLATRPSPSDRLEVADAVGRLSSGWRGEGPDVERPLHLARGLATLVDLQASLGSPVYVSEIAVASRERLPETFLRCLGGCFTSEFDVLRRPGRALVAGQRMLFGGFEIERDVPGLPEALSRGLPLRGGLQRRELRDLVTLTEQPLRWPLPWIRGVPTVPHHVGDDHPVPERFRPHPHREEVIIGRRPGGAPVALPVDLRTRHTLVTGVWGTGKSTFLMRMALEDLRAGRGFVFVDPHGDAARFLVDRARELGLPHVVIDPDDRRGKGISPFPRLSKAGRNRDVVERQIAHFCDAMRSSLPDQTWAGPRWTATMRSAFELQAVEGGSLAELVTWLNDADQLRERLRNERLSDLATATLQVLTRQTPGGEGADVLAWASSKFHALVTGPARSLFARPGSGLRVDRAVRDGVPIIANLGALPPSETHLFGHLLTTLTIEAAFGRAMGRRDLYTVYAEEASSFPAAGLSRAVAEGRKFGLGVVLAVQALGQLPRELADLALGCGTRAMFRSTPETAARLALASRAEPDRLVRLPDMRAVVASGDDAVEVVLRRPEPLPGAPSPERAQAPGIVGKAPTPLVQVDPVIDLSGSAAAGPPRI